MKRFVPLLLCAVALLPHQSSAQLSNGGIFAGFGVDADTRTNWVKYGPLTGPIPTDDWFAPSGQGFNVIDTANAASYLSQLQAGANITFSQKMSSLLYAKNGGRLWIDAVYGRDYMAASTLKDVTTFTLAGKNGDNPSNWKGGSANVPNKNDLTDVFAHMRRDGLSVHDSLWIFTAVSTYGINGSSYYDVELYKNTFFYSAGNFTTGGVEAGHTQWLFDAAGNIVQTGDLIFAVSFSPGTAPVVDLRIWVSKTTLASVTPTYFNFTGTFDGASASPVYGYASIVSKSGSTAWGGGISNYSATATQDSTYATPWGTGNASLGALWAPDFISQQYIEIGLNLTRIGVDPALYSTLNPCQPLFTNIFFKSRSSTSFTSNLQDFMIPLTFTRTPVMDYSLQPDTIRCNHQIANITISNKATAGYYTWKTLNGNIAGANSDSSRLGIDKPGTYIVSASPAEGCPATRSDTVVIPIDTFPPKPSAFSGLSGNKLALYGGDPVASNYATPFGGSSGLSYAWAGPNSFASNTRNPLTDTVPGTYSLTVTELRNGCTATASTTVASGMFIVLMNQQLILHGKYQTTGSSLTWQNNSGLDIKYYSIERMDPDRIFQTLTRQPGSIYSFDDAQPLPGDNFYRIKAEAADGQIVYSAILKIDAPDINANKIYIAGNDSRTWQLKANVANAIQTTLVIYDILGKALYRRSIFLTQGDNAISLPALAGSQTYVIALYVRDGIAWCKKLPVQ